MTDAGRVCVSCDHEEALHHWNDGDVAECLAESCRCRQFTAPSYYTLRELYENPELLRPPEVLIPRLVWRGRSTLLSAREKAGKSTLAGFATAMASRGGNIFGRRGPALRVLLVSLEEHLGDVTQRYKRLGADPDGVTVATDLPGDRIATLRWLVRTIEPAVVAIDTLPAFAEGLVDDPNNPSLWTPIMRRLTGIARDFDLGLLAIHHARKSDGRYRDSTAIGAGVDMILEMIDDNEGSCERRILAKGRWQQDSYSIRFDAASGMFDVVAGAEAPLELRVLDFIRANPHVSKNKLREGVGGKAELIDAAVTALSGRGLVQNVGKGNAHSYVSESLGTQFGTRLSETGKSLQDKAGHTRDTPSYVPDPNPIGSGDTVPDSVEERVTVPADAGEAWEPNESEAEAFEGDAFESTEAIEP